MKRISLILSWVVGLLTLSSCHVNSREMRSMMGKTKGPQVTRVLKGKYFSKIDADLVGDIIYTQSDSVKIRLVGPKAEIERMQVSFKGDKLIIDMDDDKSIGLFRNKRSGVDVYVSGPDLIEVKVEGVSDFKAKKIDTDHLLASIDGVGDIQIDTLVCDSFKGVVDGTGDLRVGHLEAMSVNAELDGTGSIKLSMVKVPNVKLSLDGTGDIHANVTDCGTVTTSVDGTGKVVLKGTCKHWIKFDDRNDDRPQELHNVNIK